MENSRLNEMEYKSNNNPKIKFSLKDNFIIRKTEVGSLKGKLSLPISKQVNESLPQSDLAKIWGTEFLKLRRKIVIEKKVKKSFNIADFFCGSGGLSLGIENALKSLGLGANFLLACDISKDSLDVYKYKFFT